MSVTTEIAADTAVASVVNAAGRSPVILVCEHASAHIPVAFHGLGLAPEAAISHIAWDPGAAATAAHLSRMLDAPLVRCNISRLVYDCNRPPEAPDAMPARSEVFDVPGNRDLSAAERAARVAGYYRPFEDLLARTIASHHCRPVLVTIHSFTPIYFGKPRAVEIGILHDEDARLADAMLAVANGYRVERNQPYGPADGVTHTLKRHGIANGLVNVMIEIRNDLVRSDADCARVAGDLGRWIATALDALGYKSDGRAKA